MLQHNTAPHKGIIASFSTLAQPEFEGLPEVDRVQSFRQWCANFSLVLFDHDRRNLIHRTAFAVLLYVIACLGREALHVLVPGPVRYLTFFPALLAAGLLGGLFPSIVLLAAFSLTGAFWIEPTETVAPFYPHLALAIGFALSGLAVVIPAVYSANAHQRLRRQDEQLGLINEELRHRVKNLFAMTSSICVQTLKAQRSTEEMCHDMIGRMQAIANAQDFLLITCKEGTNLTELVRAIVGPLCPNSARLHMSGESVALAADVTTSFALVLHELSTNAIKYGAWRADNAGIVEIRWELNRNKLSFSWRERGANISIIESKRGFGSKLFQKGIDGSQIDHHLGSGGAECTINMNI